MLQKPRKWGIKIFSRNGLSRTLYDFEFDGAPDPHKVEQIDEIGCYRGDIVLRLCLHLPKKRNFKLCFDNYFYPELLLRLKMDGFWAVGTIRQDRMRGCKLKSEKELKEEGRGWQMSLIEFTTNVSSPLLKNAKPVIVRKPG